MGTTLTGTTPATTYDSLIKVTDNGPLSGTLKTLTDGLGNDSALALSTSNVGIGTASPDATLTVSSGTANNVANFKSTDTLAYIAISDNSSTSDLGNHIAVVGDNMYFATNDSERMRITSAGNVGIGTASPNVSGYSRALTISSANSGIELTSASNVVQATMGANAQGLVLEGIGTSGVRIHTSASGATTERVRIDSTGNVGIGTDSPASLLSVGATAVYNLPASTANFSTADAGKFQLRLTSSAFNVDGNWVGLGMGYHQDYMKMAIIARASDGSARGTLNFCINSSGASANASLSDTRVSVTSNGLTFNGDTAAANALDDYEEGSWTPQISNGTTNVAISNSYSTYTKIGRQVTVNTRTVNGALSSFSSGDNISFIGLPFTSGGDYYSTIYVRGAVSGNLVRLLAVGNGTTTASTDLFVSELIDGASDYWFTITYFV